jgi:activator of HSP90 ATPase
MVRTSEAAPTLVREAVFPPVRETFVAVTELLTAIHAGDA